MLKHLKSRHGECRDIVCVLTRSTSVSTRWADPPWVARCERIWRRSGSGPRPQKVMVANDHLRTARHTRPPAARLLDPAANGTGQRPCRKDQGRCFRGTGKQKAKSKAGRSLRRVELTFVDFTLADLTGAKSPSGWSFTGTRGRGRHALATPIWLAAVEWIAATSAGPFAAWNRADLWRRLTGAA